MPLRIRAQVQEMLRPELNRRRLIWDGSGDIDLALCLALLSEVKDRNAGDRTIVPLPG